VDKSRIFFYLLGSGFFICSDFGFFLCGVCEFSCDVIAPIGVEILLLFSLKAKDWNGKRESAPNFFGKFGMMGWGLNVYYLLKVHLTSCQIY
jgi:hypothetical protein